MAGTNSITHTPGPWKLHGHFEPLHNYNDAYMAVSSETGWLEFAAVVVRVDGRSSYCPQGLANARLIAAAPDLLEALKVERERFDAVLEAIEQMSDGGDMTNLAFHYRIVGLFMKPGDGDLMRAAIAKAEGDT